MSTFRLTLTLILNFASNALARAARFAGACAHRLMARLTEHLEQHHVGAGVDELTLDLICP